MNWEGKEIGFSFHETQERLQAWISLAPHKEEEAGGLIVGGDWYDNLYAIEIVSSLKRNV